MKRPDSHVVGELGETYFRKVFTEFGWIVESIQPDYGFDFLIQRTASESVFADFALVQVKATRRLGKSNGDKAGSVTIEKKHLDLWKETAIPAFLVVVEVKNATERVFVLDSHALLGIVEPTESSGVRRARARALPVPVDSAVSPARMAAVEEAVGGYWFQVRKKLDFLRSIAAEPKNLGSRLTAASQMGVLASCFAGFTSVPGFGAGVLFALARHTVTVESRIEQLHEGLVAGAGPGIASRIIRDATGEEYSFD